MESVFLPFLYRLLQRTASQELLLRELLLFEEYVCNEDVNSLRVKIILELLLSLSTILNL